MGELNLAILGCGLVGKRHVDAIFKTEGINLIDIIDHDPTSLQGVNNLHNDLFIMNHILIIEYYV